MSLPSLPSDLEDRKVTSVSVHFDWQVPKQFISGWFRCYVGPADTDTRKLFAQTIIGPDALCYRLSELPKQINFAVPEEFGKNWDQSDSSAIWEFTYQYEPTWRKTDIGDSTVVFKINLRTDYSYSKAR